MCKANVVSVASLYFTASSTCAVQSEFPFVVITLPYKEVCLSLKEIS